MKITGTKILLKIKYLEITDFQQFKDFTLDLTYPAGHPKAGQPLDKVCFIGQSGTGKTTILKILKEFLDIYINREWKTNTFNVILHKNLYKITILDEMHGLSITLNKSLYKDSSGEIIESINIKEKDTFERDNLVYVYLPSEIIDIANQILKNLYEKTDLSDIFTTKEEIKNKKNKLKEDFEKKRSYDFSLENPLELWKIILIDYFEGSNEIFKITNLIRDAVLSNDLKLIEKYRELLQKEINSDKNPLNKLANILNPILNQFYLKLSKTINSVEDSQFIGVENLEGSPIQFTKWSTGTKQIILTATPLLILNKKDCTILFDEPERSLYPDIQRELIKYYTDLAPEAQFFFATHSPIIVSQFDPWEIVELKFDENGKVYREEYLKDGMERHIDNYKYYPKYMRWDSILTKIYDVEPEGGSERDDLLYKLAESNNLIKYYKKNGKTQELEKEVENYKKIAEKLQWKTNETN
jgi:ABC-type multidrug transport system ATPase subunit